jgi:hypothetical protein
MQPIDLVKRLNSAVPSTYITDQHLPVADEIMASLIDAFQSASVEQRGVARAELSPAARWFLLCYAWKMAEQAINQKSEKMVMQGLLTLSIEDGGMDARDSIVRMSILFRSAQKLGLDATQLFAEAADFATNPYLKTAMLQFPARPPEHRDLGRAFFIGEKTTEQGFSYEQQPWKFAKAVRRKVWLLKLRRFFGRFAG